MAVTKIRKISSWTLLLISIISLVILGMFYAGGVVDASAEMKEPIYTGLLINWTSVLFFVTAISTVLFALWQFITLLQTSPKSALASLVVVVLFAAVLFITYSMGDATPLKGLNADSQEYNVPLWLKVTDMWIYSTVVLMALIIIAVVAGSVKRMLNR
ncbi:hypothetical protein [Parabacteroides gordonii]|jgi:hypothetical protein|uniref:Uncharacterized protein n=1 Tax=Parabacteroides gordonii MS-1 = DSM 23371 TaxID=1203610 RepID=A0A0F5JC52_9BACT|nr:hypothetical protein [Parabacteroides gordonii]KKB55349.1 hypothetical protein HMPREF1536_02817 [Parabacteroides gordonii MS-1 = DSM 23371]MCA5581856.1 hypothetical protein [Parabacteroides gordonii]RGP17914.1 hypothetical protein DXB27_00315 [Parabacteroides gordonii]